MLTIFGTAREVEKKFEDENISLSAIAKIRNTWFTSRTKQMIMIIDRMIGRRLTEWSIDADILISHCTKQIAKDVFRI